jgi:hypothetical protein
MARIATTIHRKNTTMPGMAYPATLLVLATAASYPPPPGIFACSPWDAHDARRRGEVRKGALAGREPRLPAPGLHPSGLSVRAVLPVTRMGTDNQHVLAQFAGVKAQPCPHCQRSEQVERRMR